MGFIRWIQASYARSSIVTALGYGIAVLASAWAAKWAGPGSPAVLIAAVLVGLSVVATGILIRTPYPRWALVVAALILALGPFAIAFASHDRGPLVWSPVGTMGYGWFYLLLVGGSARPAPKVCAAPWAVIVGSTILVAATWIGGIL